MHGCRSSYTYYYLWSQEWLRLLLARLVAVASGEYTPLALRHCDHLYYNS